MESPNVEQIAGTYKVFWATSRELGEEDVKTYPLGKRETLRDRAERHLLGMLEMYQVRYGDPEQRLRMVTFLEKQLFRVPPAEDEVCHLTLDMWKGLRQAVLSGDYVEAERALGSMKQRKEVENGKS